MRHVELPSQKRVGLGLLLGLVFSLTLFATPEARAIPSAGDYTFTGDLHGAFTSTGSEIIKWHFSLGDSPTIWDNSDATQSTTQNDVAKFTLTTTLDRWDITASFNWPPGTFELVQSATIAIGRITVTTYAIPQYTLTNPRGVPEPSTASLMTIGLLALLGYGWRQRRQAGLQIG